jgi:hypothetical protein
MATGDGPALGRPGPVPVPGDSWDPVETGRHRVLRHRRPPWHYLWVGLLLAATALVPIVVLPLLSGGAADDPPDVAAGTTTTGAGPSRGSTAPPASASPIPSPTSGVPTAPPPPQTPVATPPGTAATFAPLVYEAEDVPSSARRRVEEVSIPGASGGRGVRFRNSWAEIEFRDVVPVTGTYRVTIAYAPDDDRSRTVVVSAAGRSVRVTLARGTGCCASASVELRLSAGGAVRIEPTDWRGRRPAIDRIIIDKP